MWFTGGLQHNNWFQWYWLSNQLVSPRVLACPSDPGKRQAVDWSRSDTGGFLSGSYRNNASSYFVGLDTFADDAYALVSGDRNMNFILSAGGDGCSSGLRYNGGFNFYSAASSGAALLPGAHGEAGNFLFLDGHVEELSSRSAAIRFMTLIERFGGDSGSSYSHYLIPN